MEPLPPNTMLLLGTRAGFDEEPTTTRLLAGVSASPIVKLIGPVEVPVGMLRSAISEITGAELFGELTVSVNVLLALSKPSLTIIVRLTVPY